MILAVYLGGRMRETMMDKTMNTAVTVRTNRFLSTMVTIRSSREISCRESSTLLLARAAAGDASSSLRSEISVSVVIGFYSIANRRKLP